MKYHGMSKQLFETNVDSSTYYLLNLSNSNLTTTLDISVNKEKLTQIDKEIEKDPSYNIFTFIKSKYEALDFSPIFENLNDINLADSEIYQEKDESQCTEIINTFNSVTTVVVISVLPFEIGKIKSGMVIISLSSFCVGICDQYRSKPFEMLAAC